MIWKVLLPADTGQPIGFDIFEISGLSYALSRNSWPETRFKSLLFATINSHNSVEQTYMR